MTYIDLINNFWTVNRANPMPPMCATVYFYLLHECNIRRWINPFELRTRSIELELSLSRDTINDCRNTLKQRGLIDFQNGKGKAPARYKIVGVKLSSKPLVVDRVDDKPDDKPDNKPTTNPTTHESLPYINNKDIKNKDIKTIKKPEKESPSSSPSELEKDVLVDYVSMLASEQGWVEDVKRMTRLDDKRLAERLVEFAAHCRAYEKQPRSLTDCKRYFLNWLKKTQTLNNNTNNTNYNNGNTKSFGRNGYYGGSQWIHGKIVPGCGLIEG